MSDDVPLVEVSRSSLRVADEFAEEVRRGEVPSLQTIMRRLWDPPIRVGDYRIIYSVNDSELIVLVVDVGHRRAI